MDAEAAKLIGAGLAAIGMGIASLGVATCSPSSSKARCAIRVRADTARGPPLHGFAGAELLGLLAFVTMIILVFVA